MRCQKSKRICPGYRDAFELNVWKDIKFIKRTMPRMINHRSFINGVGYFDAPHELGSQELLNQPLTLKTTPITASDLDIYDSFVPLWNQSKSHSSKSSTSIISSLTSGTTLSSSTSMTSTIVSPLYHPGCIPAHLSTPVDQKAACYFLSNFVLLPGNGFIRGGYMDFLIPFLKADKPNRSLQLSFSAVALAAFGTRPNSKALLPNAELSYIKALKEINSTLRDPKKASRDATLIAVLLLGFFEVS